MIHIFSTFSSIRFTSIEGNLVLWVSELELRRRFLVVSVGWVSRGGGAGTAGQGPGGAVADVTATPGTARQGRLQSITRPSLIISCHHVAFLPSRWLRSVDSRTVGCSPSSRLSGTPLPFLIIEYNVPWFLCGTQVAPSQCAVPKRDATTTSMPVHKVHHLSNLFLNIWKSRK